MELSEAEALALVEALAAGRGRRGFTQEEADNLLEWAATVYAQAVSLGNILAGKMIVRDVRISEGGYIVVTARATPPNLRRWTNSTSKHVINGRKWQGKKNRRDGNGSNGA